MNISRGLWPEALVAALASLSVGWPLTTLLEQQPWVPNAIVVVAVVAILGAVLRSVNALPSLVASMQLAAGGWVLAWMYLRPTLWLGIPTPESVSFAVDLLANAGAVLREFAAPAPTTEGVAFLVVSVLVLTAVAVDAIGVTNAAPAVAGIPLAAAFLVSVSNNGQAMAPWYFATTAALWLMMIAQQSNRLLTAWPTSERRDFSNATHFGSGYRNLARALGVLALTGALAGASLLPHLPPTFVGQGLARNENANDLGSGGGQVTFTETMDPAADLRNQSEAPVLQYTSTARLLQPLRVSATSTFDGETWQAPERSGTQIQGPDLPEPVGLSPTVSASSEEVSITRNELQAPHVAVPATTTTLNVDAATIEVNRDSGAILLDGSPDSYSAMYIEVSLDGELDAVGPTAAAIVAADPELVEVPDESRPALVAAMDEILDGETEPLAIGQLLQSHFRDSSYTYSLDLAPTATDTARDPISQFLATRQGYCVQFATAMVMMARSEGIPARMAVGFLPGEAQSNGSRTVVAADAHTWPELYIDGLGWTRFEPTPGVRTGVPPEITQTQAPEVAPEVPEVPEQEPETTPEDAPTLGESSWFDAVQAWWVSWRWVALSIVAIALVLMVIPIAGRLYRQRESRVAQSARDQIEGQWLVLTRSLTDLGVPDPGQQSPRAMENHYTERTELGADSQAALERIRTLLEQTRYSADRQLTRSTEREVTSDVGNVIEAVRTAAPWTKRARAALIPRSGTAGISQWLRRRVLSRARSDENAQQP